MISEHTASRCLPVLAWLVLAVPVLLLVAGCDALCIERYMVARADYRRSPSTLEVSIDSRYEDWYSLPEGSYTRWSHERGEGDAIRLDRCANTTHVKDMTGFEGRIRDGEVFVLTDYRVDQLRVRVEYSVEEADIDPEVRSWILRRIATEPETDINIYERFDLVDREPPQPPAE